MGGVSLGKRRMKLDGVGGEEARRTRRGDKGEEDKRGKRRGQRGNKREKMHKGETRRGKLEGDQEEKKRGPSLGGWGWE